MARFGRDFVRGATQPAYLEGLFQAGKNIGGYSRKKEQIQNSREAFNIYEQGLASARDANVGGLSAATSKLSGMLSETTDENVMSDLMQKISNLGKLTTATETAKASRNVDDLIKAENFLEELKGKGENITANESRIMEGVQQRVDQLRGDAAVVTSANAKRRDFRIASLTKDEALAVAEANAMKRNLSRFVGSDQFQKQAQKYRDRGLSLQVDKLETEVMEVMTKREELVDKLNEKAPLTPEEKKVITDLGFKITDDIKVDRKRLNTINETKFQKKLDIALRPLDPASAGLAKALVKQELEQIVQEGEIEQLPFFQDISDKVEDILEDPEELEFFLNRVDGASQAEIPGIIRKYLKGKFPKKFEEMQTEMRREATIETTKRGALSDIAASTNAARGTAAFEAGIIDEDRPLTPNDEGYFDLSNPDDADRALMLYEREETKKTKARQQKEQLGATTSVGLTQRSSFNF